MNKNLQLKSLNSIPVKNLKHLKKLIDEIETNYEDKDTILNDISKKSEKIEKSSIKPKTKKSAKKTEVASESMNEFKPMVFEFSNDQLIVLDANEAREARVQVNNCK